MKDVTKSTTTRADDGPTEPTSSRPGIHSRTTPSAATYHPAGQAASSQPLANSAPLQKKRPASISRHQRKCTVCHHPKRQEIEQDYLRWGSPTAIARVYGLAGPTAIYRHVHATGIFARRRARLRLALDPLIEQVAEVNITAHAIISAIKTSFNFQNARKWIGRPGTRTARGVNRFARPQVKAAIAEESQRISNRESAELEPDATR
jgi:hypothetical protein